MRVLVTLLALSLAATSAAPPVAAQSTRPRLVVLLMVDQMRGDYVDKYRHQWNGGLRRLLTDGAWFRQADYPYVNTVTCAGHASVATGALPSVHGMVMNTWWDRVRGRVVACADDPTAIDLSYGEQVDAPGESPASLLVPTLADELRAQSAPSSRVVSLSLKARSALTMGGQRPDAVAWVVDQGAWVTSTAFPQGLSPEIAEYIDAHPVEHQLWSTWNRALPKASYTHEEQAIGARADAWQKTFPHTIQTWEDWQTSPLSDEYLANMALHVASRMKLGAPNRTDMLAISFSALDLVGHIYGPESHEIQDVLVRLDRTLGVLLNGLDALVGRGNYVVALSADHGLAPTPERVQSYGLDAGRIPPRAIPDAAQQAISKALGRGRWVNRLMSGDLYLEEGTFEALRATPSGMEALRSALLEVPGVRAVYTRDELVRTGPSADPLLQQAANGFLPSRSGDLEVIFKPYWLVGGNGGSTHGTLNRYDTHVPIVLMGKGIKPGEFSRPVTPLDIAPTLAYLTGITLSHAQGQVLIDALATPARLSASTVRKATPSARTAPPSAVTGNGND